ncbi:RCC1 domain-containing protein [Methanocella conradii]|uniref:RCC1 domain-containing protein n=1 Tax=Methanocella conradii TaxID=1175444 RepID=UPI00157DBD4F|nr:hypothetical protein [Methanocella conradii]
MFRSLRYLVIILGLALLVEPCMASDPGVVGVDAAKGGFSLAVMSDGSVWAWGNNHYGQVGVANAQAVYTPEKVAVSNVTVVSGGTLHAVALKRDGSVWEWGHTNFYEDQSPGYDETLVTFPPVKVPLSGVMKVSAGDSFTLALCDNGSVWAWGSNYYGQLGDGTNKSSRLVRVKGLENVKDIHAGYGYSMALDKDGRVWEWGRIYKGHENNTYATPITSNALTPVEVPISNVTAISSGIFFSLALKDDGTVWAWGRNVDGQLGDGTTEDSLTPIMIPGLRDIVAISGGETASMALKKDGTVWAWGYSIGSFGNVDTDAKEYLTPIQVSISNVTAISFSGLHALALKDDDTLWAWGQNGNGEVGNSGDGAIVGYPVMVEIPKNQTGIIIDGQANNNTTMPASNSSGLINPAPAKIFGLLVLAALIIGAIVVLKKK